MVRFFGEAHPLAQRMGATISLYTPDLVVFSLWDSPVYDDHMCQLNNV